MQTISQGSEQKVEDQLSSCPRSLLTDSSQHLENSQTAEGREGAKSEFVRITMPPRDQ